MSKKCLIMEVVYWQNVMPKKDTSFTTAPANMIHHYQFRVKGVNCKLPPYHWKDHIMNKVGDRVWVKAPHSNDDQENTVACKISHSFIGSETLMCDSSDK